MSVFKFAADSEQSSGKATDGAISGWQQAAEAGTAVESGCTLPPRGLLNSCPTAGTHTITECFEVGDT